MSSQHKAPLAAFFVVSIACIVVVVNALRSDALGGLFVRPTQVVVAGARLIPEPRDILATEAKVVARASAGIAAAPEVVDQVVAQTGKATPATRSSHAVPAAPKPKHHQIHRAHHAPLAATAPPATHVVIPAPPVVPVVTPPQQIPTVVTHGHAGEAHGWQAHQTQASTVPAYGLLGHQSDSAAWSRAHHENRGRGSRGQWGGFDNRMSQRVDVTQAGRWGNGNGNGNGWGNGNSNGWGNRSSHGHGH